jgi:hypothetical protein
LPELNLKSGSMFNKILEELDRTELWQPYSDEIAVAEHKHILSNLALVCHFFCTVLLPQIFKSLKFSGLPHKESDTPGYMSFCRALIRGKEPAHLLVLHVRECTFSQWDTHDQWVFNGFFWGSIIKRSHVCQTLNHLFYFVHPSTRNSLSKLTQLKVLVMEDCKVYDDVMDQEICKLLSLKLVMLEFCGDNYIHNLLKLISPVLHVF